VTAEAALGQLNTAIDWLEGFPDRLNRGIDDLVNRINSLLAAVPGVLQKLIDDIVEQAKALLARITELGKQLLQWLGENVWPVIRGPFTLYETGTAWTTTAYKQTTDVSGQVDLQKIKVDDYWQGPAANAYLQSVGVQKAAVDGVAGTITTARETIQGLAMTLGALYVALVACLIAAAIQLAGGSAAVASVLGIPPGLMLWITGLLTAIGGVGAIYAGGKELVSGSAEKLAKLQAAMENGSAFDHGHWPKATTGIGDASMSDGDRSDWNYKR
jgi:hypothetical protein